MKKLFLSIVAALCCTASMYAELTDELVATLNHNGTLTAYYGSNAFIEAMKNVENGDEITLTGGEFNSTEDPCRKAITIRGAGIKEVVENRTKATTINGTLNFYLPVDTNEKLFIEGVRLGTVNVNCSELKDAVISKCYIDYVTCKGSLLTVVDCEVKYFYSGDAGYANIKNCLVRNAYQNAAFQCTYDHCFVNYVGSVDHTVFRHCIINNKTDYPYTTQLINCILPDRQSYYTKVRMESCYIVNGIVEGSEFLKHLFGSDTVWGHLTDKAKSQYPGTDGTEIGIWGGDYPYDTTITLPYVTNLITGKRTSGGQLPVTIEVK